MLKHSNTIGACIAALGLGILISAASTPGTSKVKVVRVIDGDTVVVRSGGKEEKVRLACIDAPEKGQPYYNEARIHLTTLLSASPIYLTRMKKDFYGRTVGKLYNNAKEMVNLEMVATGSAWLYHQYLRDCEEARHDFLQAEYVSKTGKNGLWSDANPMEPWNFRKK